ncbi:MAG: anaerobic ribonucleoside-triphosphate reductase activating protein [Prevotella sp.]|nr:anaerobic ribonucleoside-triphosphate reductase activating protein [Prevotella sp.]
MISVLEIIEDTMVDGPGFRTSIYCAGCPHKCPGCQNPQSWDMTNGQIMTTEDIMQVIMNDPFANVTFSGGDPMFQAEGFAELALAIHMQSNKTIWCFTGFLYENLLKHPAQKKLLELIDVLVDGPFVQALRDKDLYFRGSSNQRLIDVPASLEKGRTILLNYNPLADC